MKDTFEHFGFRTNIVHPFVKKQGLSNAQFRIEIASELCVRLPLFFNTRGTKIQFVHLQFYNYTSSYYMCTSKKVLVYTYVYLNISTFTHT